MIPRTELRRIARARLSDAHVLFRARRYDGAMYLCGYAVEMALKARICRTLHWGAYPSTRAEFQEFQSLRTHNLITLLKLSGVEDRIRTNFVSEWSGVAAWDPEARYKPIGTASRRETQVMIESAQVLIRKL